MYGKLPDTAHLIQPWRIHELTRDFRLEDVWGIRAPGGPYAFARAVPRITRFDPSRSRSLAVRALFAIREKLGSALGWDGVQSGVGERVATLRERLPRDLRHSPGPEFAALPFTSLYLVENEWAAEAANETMHGVLHIGLVNEGNGDYHAQMAVLVKPNGVLGDAYMAAIRPFRHLIVYPRVLSEVERAWR